VVGLLDVGTIVYVYNGVGIPVVGTSVVGTLVVGTCV